MTRVFGELGFGEMGHNRTEYIAGIAADMTIDCPRVLVVGQLRTQTPKFPRPHISVNHARSQIRKQGVTLMERNRTGPPCSVQALDGRPAARRQRYRR